MNSRPAMHIAAALVVSMLAASPCLAQSAQTSRIDYDAALGWLADSRIDGNALNGARGSIAINQAAGDINLQANLRSIAVGTHAVADVIAIQQQTDNHANAPIHASAVIGGRALQGAGGIASINQASGSGNTELNAVSVALAQQGIREASDDFLSATGIASAVGAHTVNEPGDNATHTRKVGVEATALQGFEGVLQLNQVAGMANATENRLQVTVQGP